MPEDIEVRGEEDDNDDVGDPEFGGGGGEFGEDAGEEGGEGADSELAEQNHASRASELSTHQFLVEKALAFADCQISYAEQLYCEYIAPREHDHGLTVLPSQYEKYTAKRNCGMAVSNTDVIRSVNREMNAKLAATSMYNRGQMRNLIETAMGRVVDESAPQLALAYREEERLEDLTYYSYIKTMNSLIDKSSLYVGTAAMGSVAENQLLLAANSARAAERSISSLTSLAVQAVDYFTKNKEVIPPTRPADDVSVKIGDKQAPLYGDNAPVRPDNPEGYNPNATPLPPPSEGTYIQTKGTGVGVESVSTPGGIGGV